MTSSGSGSSRLKNLIHLIRTPAELASFFRESPRIQKLLKKLPSYVTLLFVTLALYSAALLTWKIIPEPILQAPLVSAGSNLDNPNNKGSFFTANQIGKWGLFGQSNNKNRKITVKPMKTVRETNIRIGLIGIVYSEHKHENRIILSNGKSRDILYKIGSTLPGNIKVDSIHPNHVILIINNVRVRKTLKTVEAREAQQKKGKISQKNN